MPDGALAIQKLLSLSTKQLCRRGSSTLKSPQELATLPAGSSSMIGGAKCPAFKSPSSTSCRFRSNTWSWASTHTPPSPPSIHWSGKGFGQDRSTSYLGAVLCARNEGKQRIPAAIANAVHVPTLPKERVFVFMFVSSSLSPINSAGKSIAPSRVHAYTPEGVRARPNSFAGSLIPGSAEVPDAKPKVQMAQSLPH